MAKERADHATAARRLERPRELCRQTFTSQAALDAAQNQLDTLNGQPAVAQAALESARVTRTDRPRPAMTSAGVLRIRDPRCSFPGNPYLLPPCRPSHGASSSVRASC